jgi:arginine N-succinyltransferase
MMPTLVVRAIKPQDLDGLLALAQQIKGGMTTLVPDRAILGARVALACASFAGQVAPAQRDYVFVMEDMAAGCLAGVCAIRAGVGLDEAFYNYRIGTLVHASRELNVFSRMETLYLSNDLTGCAELCSLFLHPDYRNGNNGKLLSKSRFLFIAQFPHLFPEKLIAEMRGFLRADGSSPFWDSLGRHFFMMDFHRADDLSSVGKKSFIAELMPRHPLYVTYLSQEAQDVIGQVHVDTMPARRLLEQEGLHYEGYVDIFDAGPVLQARIGELRALRDSGLFTAFTAVAGSCTAMNDGVPMLASNTALDNFRVIVTATQPDAGRHAVVLQPDEQALLACGSGDRIRVMPLSSRKNAPI